MTPGVIKNSYIICWPINRAGIFYSLPEFNLAYLIVFLNQKHGERLDYLQNEVSCLGFTPEIFAPLTVHVTAIYFLGGYASSKFVT